MAQQGALAVRLLAEADGLSAETLGAGLAIQTSLPIGGGHQVEDHWDQVGIGEALTGSGRVIGADGQPEDWAVADVLPGAEVLLEELEDHLRTELKDAIAAPARELATE